MRLFDDEPEEVFADLTVIPDSYIADYCCCATRNSKFGTLQQPSSFKVVKSVGQAAKIDI